MGQEFPIERLYYHKEETEKKSDKMQPYRMIFDTILW